MSQAFTAQERQVLTSLVTTDNPISFEAVVKQAQRGESWYVTLFKSAGKECVGFARLVMICNANDRVDGQFPMQVDLYNQRSSEPWASFVKPGVEPLYMTSLRLESRFLNAGAECALPTFLSLSGKPPFVTAETEPQTDMANLYEHYTLEGKLLIGMPKRLAYLMGSSGRSFLEECNAD